MNDLNYQYTKLQIIKRLLSYVKDYKWKVVFVVLLLLLVMGCGTITPYLMRISIDKFISNNDFRGLINVGIGLLIINLISPILSGIRTISMSKITNRILVDIRHSLYTHIQTLNFEFFDNRPVGKIISRVVGDVNALQNLLNNSISNLIPNIFTIIFK